MNVLSDENSHVHQLKPSKVPDMAGKKNGSDIRSKRRALSLINHNIGEGQRPVTRKCSYQMGHTGDDVDSKKLKTSSTANEFRAWEDIPLADEEEAESKNQSEEEPITMEHSDNERMSLTEEVEMEDIFEEQILDIDGCDAKNPLAASDYVEDIYAYYKKVESSSCVSPDYMSRQFDINEKMRAILIDWLIEVHHKFELREETLFLTVNLIDRFLEKQCVVRKKLQLVGLVALLLACKYEEVSVPVVEDLIFISDRAYLRAEVLEMESSMLNTLQFNMSVPTAYVFLKRFLKAAQADEKLEQVSFFLVELCLVEYEMVKYSPSLMAAAAVYAAQSTLYGVGLWSKTCEWHSTYAEDRLMECARMIVSFHEKAATGKLTGVYRKYGAGKYGCAAKVEPTNYLVRTTPR